MKRLALLGVAAVALAAAVPAQATGLSLTGETGVARTPQAISLAPKSLTLAGDFVASSDLFLPLRVEVGVVDGLEIGGSYWFEDTTGNPTVWGWNAKYVIPAETIEGLSIAAGLGYQSLSADGGIDFATIKVYGVATYRIGTAVAVLPSVGFSYEIQGGDKDESGVRFFASAVAQVMPNLAVGAEINSTNEDLDGDGADSDVWVGARFSPKENLTLQAGLINNANVGGNDPADFCFHVGVQYTFNFAQ